MRVLFVGLGSIGKRNLESCLRVRPDHTYAALRSSERTIDPGVFPGIPQLSELGEAQAFRPELVWICNPTSLHREALERLFSVLSEKPALFIEKPLAHTTADAHAIAERLKDAKFFYGCLLRQHPLIERVREAIHAREVGRALAYQICCSSYLPDWRKDQDYRKNYSARRSMGGGVTLDLIHEFDYAEMWFGPIAKLHGFKTRVSELEIDSDDLCIGSALHGTGVAGQIFLSYFRPAPRRDFEITCTGGLIQGDVLEGKLKLGRRDQNGTIVWTEESHPIGRDELHDRQTRQVFEALEGRGGSPWNIDEAARLVSQISELEFLEKAR